MTMTRRDLIGAGAAALLTGPVLTGRAAASTPPSPQQVFHDPDAPEFGNPKGDVTVVEFYDYECPFCKKMYPMMIDVIGQDGNVRLVMKDWPILSMASVRAAKLTLGTIGSGQYEAAHNALMATTGRLTDAKVDTALKAVGVDPKQAMAGYQKDAAKWGAYLARNDAQARAFGFSGTPGLVIGYTLFNGALDEAGFRKAIAEARAAGKSQ